MTNNHKAWIALRRLYNAVNFRDAALASGDLWVMGEATRRLEDAMKEASDVLKET